MIYSAENNFDETNGNIALPGKGSLPLADAWKMVQDGDLSKEEAADIEILVHIDRGGQHSRYYNLEEYVEEYGTVYPPVYGPAKP